MKQVVIFSDGHAGHNFGLTPPWMRSPDERCAEYERYSWDWLKSEVRALGDIDLLIYNGDAIEGKGQKSGGCELITTDRSIQVDMAISAVEMVKAKNVAIIRGTGYHVGNEEDWEGVLAKQVNAIKYGGHEFFDVEGVILDCKHKVGSSAVDHLRNTSISRENLHNLLWHEKGIQPRADIIIRSHVHYYVHTRDKRGDRLTTPALQAWTKYGADQCSGTIDIGFISIKCDTGKYDITAHFLDLGSLAQEAVKI